MKKLFILFSLVVVVAAASYDVRFHRAMASVAITPDGTDAELAWLRREFLLTPAQYDQIFALHQSYRPVCGDHCARYMTAHRRLADRLKTQASWTAEADALITEQARIQGECHASMLKYAYAVAANMSPDEGKRYLEMVKLQLLDGDPAGMFSASR